MRALQPIKLVTRNGPERNGGPTVVGGRLLGRRPAQTIAVGQKLGGASISGKSRQIAGKGKGVGVGTGKGRDAGMGRTRVGKSKPAVLPATSIAPAAVKRRCRWNCRPRRTSHAVRP
mmetsp:Transcript_130327/g.363114  ORF Transcript_130327/g.363114 Transcript_130327/m.363114 type:complete len:117 (-) Transcript_130327:459-809(-)